MQGSIKRSIENTICMCDSGSPIVKLVLFFMGLVAMSIGMQYPHEFPVRILELCCIYRKGTLQT
jgi:hypothetical protein